MGFSDKLNRFTTDCRGVALAKHVKQMAKGKKNEISCHLDIPNVKVIALYNITLRAYEHQFRYCPNFC